MEQQYLALLSKILNNGSERTDRTGVGTLSLFGERLECNLADGFPLLTTKRVPFSHVAKELLWFIRGQTDAGVLDRDGVKIWNANSSAEFLAARGLSYAPGDIGPGYGFQWRHFGAKYTNCGADYTGQGVDQLARLVDGLKTDPYSRRHYITAWNPAQIDAMALPPCHLSAQFYVSGAEGAGGRGGGPARLCCQLYQRSADAFLGLPWNIASYALLTHIIAALVGLQPGELILCLGDVHVYKNHLDAVKTQLARTPAALPTVSVGLGTANTIDDIDEQKISLTGYSPATAIAAPMAV